ASEAASLAALPLLGARPTLTAQEFQEIRKFIYDQAGIDLHAGKEDLVAVRLGKKLMAAGLKSYQEYFRLVKADRTGNMLTEMIDALTTNFTGFMREPVHFEFLRKTVLPVVAKRQRIDFWSAACSTGEEPYTIAFVALEALGAKAAQQVRILATDISTKVLKYAGEALYPAERITGIPQEWRKRYLTAEPGARDSALRVRPEVKRMVEFQRMNLMEPLRAGRRCPVIFLRNVMIYFDRATQESLVKRLAEHLEPGGYLLIGHSESLTGMPVGLEYVAPATYRKPGKLQG
ncbi:MAG: protein-glutamate O-methyltransferase CheR, partial [Acidobacteria bacterium]|nr:protein-glutamate O-methyltransferase CheR [Acidobacteriota bacterium]